MSWMAFSMGSEVKLWVELNVVIRDKRVAPEKSTTSKPSWDVRDGRRRTLEQHTYSDTVLQLWIVTLTSHLWCEIQAR